MNNIHGNVKVEHTVGLFLCKVSQGSSRLLEGRPEENHEEGRNVNHPDAVSFHGLKAAVGNDEPGNDDRSSENDGANQSGKIHGFRECLDEISAAHGGQVFARKAERKRVVQKKTQQDKDQAPGQELVE